MMEQLFDELELDMYNLYSQLDKTEVWKLGNDEVCDLCEELVKKIIRKSKQKYLAKKEVN